MENRIDRKDDESRYQPKIHSDRIKLLYNLKQETWEDICEYRQLLDRLDYLKCLEELEKIKVDATENADRR